MPKETAVQVDMPWRDKIPEGMTLIDKEALRTLYQDLNNERVSEPITLRY